jgi:hypothetical protein
MLPDAARDATLRRYLSIEGRRRFLASSRNQWNVM